MCNTCGFQFLDLCIFLPPVSPEWISGPLSNGSYSYVPILTGSKKIASFTVADSGNS